MSDDEKHDVYAVVLVIHRAHEGGRHSVGGYGSIYDVSKVRF